jgi:hypothetical protein
VLVSLVSSGCRGRPRPAPTWATRPALCSLSQVLSARFSDKSGDKRQGRAASASRAWKVRPGTPLSRDTAPMAQLGACPDRPLLSVGDRHRPLLRARGGTAGEDRAGPRPGSDGHRLNRRVRLVPGDHLPRVGKPRRRHGSLTIRQLRGARAASAFERAAGQLGLGTTIYPGTPIGWTGLLTQPIRLMHRPYAAVQPYEGWIWSAARKTISPVVVPGGRYGPTAR